MVIRPVNATEIIYSPIEFSFLILFRAVFALPDFCFKIFFYKHNTYTNSSALKYFTSYTSFLPLTLNETSITIMLTAAKNINDCTSEAKLYNLPIQKSI